MSKDEMNAMLAEHLAKFRSWTYAQLADAVERTRREHDCLEHLVATASDGMMAQLEFNVYWEENKPGGDVRVIGDLSALPQKPLLGFIPIFTPDVIDSFIMRPDGSFVGETDEKTV